MAAINNTANLPFSIKSQESQSDSQLVPSNASITTETTNNLAITVINNSACLSNSSSPLFSSGSSQPIAQQSILPRSFSISSFPKMNSNCDLRSASAPVQADFKDNSNQSSGTLSRRSSSRSLIKDFIGPAAHSKIFEKAKHAIEKTPKKGNSGSGGFSDDFELQEFILREAKHPSALNSKYSS